jgi:uncharacterized protein YggE
MKSMFFLTFLFSKILFAANPQLISVNGIAERSIDPNSVVVQIELYGKASSAKIAQDLQAKEYQRVKDTTEKFKIKKNDFTTQNYSIHPEYIYDQKTQSNKLNGYRVIHQIKLIFKKIDEAGKLIDELTSKERVDSSGVQIQSISWDSDQKSTAESLAMADAVIVAKEKAEILAKSAGVKIKNVYLISQNSSSDMVATPRFEGNFKSMAMDAGGSAQTSLNGGQIKVRSEVHMQFEIN